MAVFVLTNAYVSVAGTEISTYVKSVTLEYKSELQDKTTMGNTTRARKGGLLDWTVTLELLQDFVDDGLDEDFFALVGQDAALAIRPVNTTISTSNPEYQGTGVLEGYSPIGNAVGELAAFTATFQANSALVRDVTP